MEEPDDAYMDEEEDIEAASGGAKAINQRTNSGSIKVAPEDSVAPADREDMREDVS
jgi:complement component 1 Q subcomponent-binding protein